MLRRRELCPREKRGAGVGKTKKGKGTKWMLLVDGAGTPLGAHLDSARPSETKLLEDVLYELRLTYVEIEKRVSPRPR